MNEIRILHTSDWHLGKRMGQYDRTKEHQLFLNWLIETINSKKIDCIVISGDVFDTGNPSNTALKLYYDFLCQVKNTTCKDVVIIGGNHDSATTLEAPKDLLKYFNIHIAGSAPENTEEQILPIKDNKGNITAIICAVPFLRDKDIRLSIAGETLEEREQRIKEGIVRHYQQLIPLISEFKSQHIPVIATGHLFAAGSMTSPDSEKEIHVGNLGQISGAQFPEEFDYIALGHLHRPQIVGKMNHIRYSGSPIALSFSENEDRKIVLVCDFESGNLTGIEEVEIPACRQLIRIKGGLETVKAKLLILNNANLHEDKSFRLPAWIEIQVNTESPILYLQEQLQILIKDNPYTEELFIRQIRIKDIQNISEQTEEALSLKDLDPVNVFIKKCEAEFGNENFEDLKQTFSEALELMCQIHED